VKTALVSSYAKDEPLLRLGKLLVGAGWTLLGSAGTTSYFKEHGIPCTDVAGIVGPPILGHRVVTLSREIHAGLLAATDDDFKELERLRILRIDLVYVTLYPLEDTIADPNATPADVIEKTDIGGPTILRAAAKGRRLTLSNSEQVRELESWFSRGCPESECEQMKLRFAAAAERRVAQYVDASARYWEKQITK